MSQTKPQKIELSKIHTQLKPVYNIIMKMNTERKGASSFAAMYRATKKYCQVMTKALPVFQKYAQHFTYSEICDELVRRAANKALKMSDFKDFKSAFTYNNADESLILLDIIGEFRQSRYIDDKFQTSLQAHSLEFPDIDAEFFGIRATTPHETIERYRTVVSRDWTDEGFIAPDGTFYYVGSDHLLSLNWLEIHGLNTENWLRIANPNNGVVNITNGKDEKTAIALTSAQAKALVTLYRIMKLKRLNMKPLSISLFIKSENLGFDRPNHVSTGLQNAKKISLYANSEEFDYNQALDALHSIKATGLPPVLQEFKIR